MNNPLLPETPIVLAKQAAIKQFLDRRATALQKIVNQSLPAESPMYFYCEHCNILSDTVAESYLFPPYLICSQCKGLQDSGWLEEAKKSIPK